MHKRENQIVPKSILDLTTKFHIDCSSELGKCFFRINCRQPVSLLIRINFLGLPFLELNEHVNMQSIHTIA